MTLLCGYLPYGSGRYVYGSEYCLQLAAGFIDSMICLYLLTHKNRNNQPFIGVIKKRKVSKIAGNCYGKMMTQNLSKQKTTDEM